MISYVTGPLGAGKSAYGARRVARALLQGKCVAGNMRLREDFARVVLGHAPHYRIAGKRAKREFEREMQERYYYSESLPVLVSLRVRGRGENRCLRIIDEAHNEMNNRDWAEDNQKVQLRKMSLSRKRGFEDLVIAQHKDNTDAAIRRICSMEIRVMDWQQVTRLPVLQTKLLPFHLFLAQGFLTNFTSVVSASRPVWKELYPLGWWAKLYDTHEDFEYGSGDDDLAVWLPQRSGGAGDAALAVATRASAAEMMAGDNAFAHPPPDA